MKSENKIKSTVNDLDIKVVLESAHQTVYNNILYII